MVLHDLFPQRGQLPQSAGNSTSGLGVLNALTQQLKQTSLQNRTQHSEQWKEFHQLLKGALQQARQDVRDTRRDERAGLLERHHERIENRFGTRVEARVEARAARQENPQKPEPATSIESDTSAETPTEATSATLPDDGTDTPIHPIRAEWEAGVCGKSTHANGVGKGGIPQNTPSDITQTDQDALDALIEDLRQLGLTLPGETADAPTPPSDSTASTIPRCPTMDNNPTSHSDDTMMLDTTSLLDALPAITEQLQTLLPKLPPHEQHLLTQALKGLEHFNALVNPSVSIPVATTDVSVSSTVTTPELITPIVSTPSLIPTTSIPSSTTKTTTDIPKTTPPVTAPPVNGFQESIKNVVKALPDEAKEALKQVFQLLNDAKHARLAEANEIAPVQVVQSSNDFAKPAFEAKFIHPLQALLRHLGQERPNKPVTLSNGTSGSTTDDSARGFASHTPTLADLNAIGTTDASTDTSGIAVPFTPITPVNETAVDHVSIALSTTISMASRFGMANPIGHNRPQVVNMPIQSQVVEAAQIAIKNGKNELMVQLNPQHLGKVTVTLTSDANKQVTAVLVTESSHVKNELEKDIKTFIRSMEHHGVQLVKVSVIQAASESQTAHNAAQDHDAAQQQSSQQSLDQHPQGSESHSQREAFEWRQQLLNPHSIHFDEGLAETDALEIASSSSLTSTPDVSASTTINPDGGVDLRA